jgi:hypothetical protein
VPWPLIEHLHYQCAREFDVDNSCLKPQAHLPEEYLAVCCVDGKRITALGVIGDGLGVWSSLVYQGTKTDNTLHSTSLRSQPFPTWRPAVQTTT